MWDSKGHATSTSFSAFWFRASSKTFYKNTKSPNCSFGINKHLNNFLSGQYVTYETDQGVRYVTYGMDLTENYGSERYNDFSDEKTYR